MKKYRAIGVMSGTSLDGLDIALCEFTENIQKWRYKILNATTFSYSEEWIKKLLHAGQLSPLEFVKLHNEYGIYIGKSIMKFLKGENVKINLIASHGHTIFHQPASKITFQLGNGAAIASVMGVTTVSDFRSLDVLLGGQGAPLVPIGDELLFGEYDYCVNLGGFANISYQYKNKRLAYDICPVNIAINHLMERFNKNYDKNGEKAKQGVVKNKLLNDLNRIGYYRQPSPKSLGKEWFQSVLLPVLLKYSFKTEDTLRTLYEHIAIQVDRSTKINRNKKILCSGGGTKNVFLMNQIQQKISHELIKPDNLLIDFKEALIFAFLGIVRSRNESNCLSSVTGAKYNHTGGCIYM